MNKSARNAVVGIGFLILVSGLGALEARGEQGSAIELTIQGESLPVLLSTFSKQHGHTFVVDPRVGKGVLGTHLYASGLSLSRAVAVIAAAYGVCAMEMSEKVTKIVPCAQEN